VYGLLAGAVTEVMLSFIFIRPLPSFAFNLAKVKEVIHHGKWVTLYGLFAYFAQESDDIVVGKVLGLSPLGSYQIAYNFGTLPITEITEVVQKVIFPTYAGIADNKKQLRNAFIKTSGILSLLIICMGLFIYFFAGSIVSFILGMRWVGIVPVLRLLIIYGTIRAISGLATPLFLAVGKQRTVAAATFLRFLGLVITIIPFLSMYGINGAGYASIVSAVCELPVMLYYVRKELA
jgi:O-antigen/teichoic acid export membrane protein